jgi:hypothetical protein
MSREVALLLLSFSCSAAIWPPTLDAYKRLQAVPIEAAEADAAVWKEYGLQESERAEYQRPGRATKIAVEAWRLGDATSAVAASQWVKGLAPATAVVHTQGNYVVLFRSGYRPSAGELEFWTDRLPGYKYGPAPTLPSFLPKENRLAGRDRFIQGPASLQAFLPAVSAQTAAFEPFQTEAQVAEYAIQGVDTPVKLALFRFPTPAIAKQQLKEFEKVPGAKVKRSGPTISIAFTENEEIANNLLKGVSFDVLFNYTETMPTKMPNVAGMILAIFELAGVVILVGLGGGLLVAGWLVFARRSREAQAEQSGTTLKLDG